MSNGSSNENFSIGIGTLLRSTECLSIWYRVNLRNLSLNSKKQQNLPNRELSRCHNSHKSTWSDKETDKFMWYRIYVTYLGILTQAKRRCYR